MGSREPSPFAVLSLLTVVAESGGVGLSGAALPGEKQPSLKPCACSKRAAPPSMSIAQTVRTWNDKVCGLWTGSGGAWREGMVNNSWVKVAPLRCIALSDSAGRVQETSAKALCLY